MSRIIRHLLIGAAASSLTACAHHAVSPGSDPRPPASAGAQDQQWLEYEKKFGGNHEVQDVLKRYKGVIQESDIAYDAPGVVALERGTDRALCQTNNGPITCKDLAQERKQSTYAPAPVSAPATSSQPSKITGQSYSFKVVGMQGSDPQCIRLGHKNDKPQACRILLQQAQTLLKSEVSCNRGNVVAVKAPIQPGQVITCAVIPRGVKIQLVQPQ